MKRPVDPSRRLDEKKDFQMHEGGSGRHRAKRKSEEDVLAEHKAKGHMRDQGEEPGEEWNGAGRARGSQKGFGKNQEKEATDRTTTYGGKSHGGFHN